jgi:SP family general alpha glucoside:H+ symporter-like MFS transporter
LIVTLAPNQIALLLGQLLCGFPWGIFAALAPAYSVSAYAIIMMRQK